MEAVTPPQPWVLLATLDPALVESVQASALALGVEVRHLPQRDGLAHHWGRAALRLVGVDLAPRVGAMALDTAASVVVGGRGDGLVAASAQLRMPALQLPDAADQLAEFLLAATSGLSRGRLVTVVGASGGLGASTLTVGLAARAASRGLRVAVVELAACGGGIDLLLGIEAQPGLRWADLDRAAGHLGDLGPELLSASGFDVVPLDRGAQEPPGAAAVQAVLGSLLRSHDVVLVDGDAPRVPHLGAAEVVLLVGADVRGVAAARMTLARWGLQGAHLVVRRGPAMPVAPDEVAAALGLELLGELRGDRRIAHTAAAGLNVASPGSRRFTRDTARLWQGLR